MRRSSAIASAKWFLNAAWLPFIIDSCHLKHVDNWTVWRDEADNRLVLTENRKIRIYPSNKEELTTSDIYRFAGPYEITRHSYWLMALVNEIDKTHQLWFLGNDDRLRFLKHDNGYKNMLPLLSGTKALKQVAELAGTISIQANKEIIIATTTWPPTTSLHASVDPILKRLQNKHGW